MSNLVEYRAKFGDIPGFFMFDAMVAWEFFLEEQNMHRIAGHFLEIGVYHGRSAILGAMYLRPDELCVLNDINSLKGCEAALISVHPNNNIFLQVRSSELLQDITLMAEKGKFRWVHIDGDHAGHTVIRDLSLAADVVADAGIICVDDFFNTRYPQLSAAVFRFLFDRGIEFKLVFCGSNKAYICRAGWYAFYERLIRTEFLAVCKRHGINLPLHKSSYAYDFGCFSVSWAEADKPEREIIGLDSNPDEIVF